VPTRLGWPRHQPTIAAGPGFCLRPFTADDIEGIYQAHLDPEHQRFIPVRQPYTRANAERFALGVSAEMWAEESGCTFALAETDPATAADRLIGSVGVPHIDYSTGQASVGYWVAPWGRGRGAATAGLRAITEWLFTDLALTSALLQIDPANGASIAVAHAAGFTRLPEDATYCFEGTDLTFEQWLCSRVTEPLVTANPEWLSTLEGDTVRVSD
jgi:RimJ/RimL family protein N-acetyltransferase